MFFFPPLDFLQHFEIYVHNWMFVVWLCTSTLISFLVAELVYYTKHRWLLFGDFYTLTLVLPFILLTIININFHSF